MAEVEVVHQVQSAKLMRLLVSVRSETVVIVVMTRSVAYVVQNK